MLKGERDRAFGSVSPSDKTFMITLKEKSGELFKANASLREESPKLKWKSAGKVGRGEILVWLCVKLIVNLNHSTWRYIMQTNGLVKRKWKTEEHF